MADKLTFELVSPEKLIFSKPVSMVTVPGGEGEYGVLPGHAPMITTVRPGVLEIFADDAAVCSDRIFVSGGFAEITPQGCTVLADEAIPVAELSRSKLEQMLAEISSKTEGATDSQRALLIAQQAVITAKLQVAA